MSEPRPLLYRARPILVEAFQWQPDNPDTLEAVTAWLTSHSVDFEIVGRHQQLLIPTFVGVLSADNGDWITRDETNTFTTHSPGAMAAQYEPVL